MISVFRILEEGYHDLASLVFKPADGKLKDSYGPAYLRWLVVTTRPGWRARALATLILYRHGYDLGRFYSPEEVYAHDQPSSYGALQTHLHHNDYEGRAVANLTDWRTGTTKVVVLGIKRTSQPISRLARSVLSGGPDGSRTRDLWLDRPVC